jgi:hypothetical protein
MRRVRGMRVLGALASVAASVAASAALVAGPGVVAAGGQTTAPSTATAQATAPDDGPIGYLSGVRVGKAAASSPCDFFKVELDTGELTRINSDGEQLPCYGGLAFSPDGTLYAFVGQPVAGIPESVLVTIDLTTGAPTTVGQLPQIITGGMTFDGTGDLWLYASAPNDPQCGGAPLKACLWEVDPATAKATFAGSTPGRAIGGLGAVCTRVLALDGAVGTGSPSKTVLSSVDTNTAELTSVVPTPEIFAATGLDVGEDGRLWAIGSGGLKGAGQPRVFQIDPEKGVVASAGTTLDGGPYPGFLTGLAVDPAHCDAPDATPFVITAPNFTG